MQIPIQNIYYLLCYAWNKLDESDIVDVKAIDTTELIDLFAKILSNGVSRLLKQGLDRYYVEHENPVIGIKGKLNLTSTVKSNILHLSKTVCSYDEFDYNILHNQILKTTLRKLLRTNNIDTNIRDELHKVYIKLPPISEIVVRKFHFKQIKLHRNNYHYDFILKVCQIINENLFINESDGNYKFKDFIRDEKAMAYLFQEFVKNFYKIETDYRVKGDTIVWQFTSERQDDIEMLPVMLTDISLYSNDRKIIIDTKYYKEAFKTRFDKQRLDPNNLYQLFAYLKNQENEEDITKRCEGILLYPSVNNDFEYSFQYENHKIRVMSINLNQDWKRIRTDLLEIVA